MVYYTILIKLISGIKLEWKDIMDDQPYEVAYQATMIYDGLKGNSYCFCLINKPYHILLSSSFYFLLFLNIYSKEI